MKTQLLKTFDYADGLAIFGVSLIFFGVLLWTVIWKGVALWRAARGNDVKWFVILLLINTLGILEIIYLYFVRPDKKKHGK